MALKRDQIWQRSVALDRIAKLRQKQLTFDSVEPWLEEVRARPAVVKVFENYW